MADTQANTITGITTLTNSLGSPTLIQSVQFIRAQGSTISTVWVGPTIPTDLPSLTAASSPDQSLPSIVSTTPIFSHTGPFSPALYPVPSISANSSRSILATPLRTHPSTNIPIPSNGLSNGTVAGIVIGVGISLALLTFCITFVFMRGRRYSEGSKRSGLVDAGSSMRQNRLGEPKEALIIQNSTSSASVDNFLPQSVDDKTIQAKVKTMFVHIELHVENFYQNAAAPSSKLDHAGISAFDSPYLPSTLPSLLTRTENRMLLIQHALAHFITACISTSADPEQSLLPLDFVALPSAIRAGGTAGLTKPAFVPSMSRWRVLTAYLRPDPSEDASYIAQRENKINEYVRMFSKAFAPYKNHQGDGDRARSLFTIMSEAADLGILIFSQPSDLQFRWQKKYAGQGVDRVAVAPELVKMTDERGRLLSEPQVMVEMIVQRG